MHLISPIWLGNICFALHFVKNNHHWSCPSFTCHGGEFMQNSRKSKSIGLLWTLFFIYIMKSPLKESTICNLKTFLLRFIHLFCRTCATHSSYWENVNLNTFCNLFIVIVYRLINTFWRSNSKMWMDKEDNHESCLLGVNIACRICIISLKNIFVL